MTDDLWRLLVSGLFVWLVVSLLAGLLWVFVMTRRPR